MVINTYVLGENQYNIVFAFGLFQSSALPPFLPNVVL